MSRIIRMGRRTRRRRSDGEKAMTICRRKLMTRAACIRTLGCRIIHRRYMDPAPPSSCPVSGRTRILSDHLSALDFGTARKIPCRPLQPGIRRTSRLYHSTQCSDHASPPSTYERQMEVELSSAMDLVSNALSPSDRLGEGCDATRISICIQDPINSRRKAAFADRRPLSRSPGPDAGSGVEI